MQHTDYGPEQIRRFKADETGRLYKAENMTFSSPNAVDSSSGEALGLLQTALGARRGSSLNNGGQKAEF